MKVEDVLDLKGYLMSLPAVKAEHHPPDVLLGPIGTALARRITGLWKLLALKSAELTSTPMKPRRGIAVTIW